MPSAFGYCVPLTAVFFDFPIFSVRENFSWRWSRRILSSGTWHVVVWWNLPRCRRTRQ